MSEQKTFGKRFVEFMLGEKEKETKRQLMVDLGWDGGLGVLTYLLTESPEYSIVWTTALATGSVLRYKTGYYGYNLLSRGIYRLFNYVKNKKVKR